MMKTAVQIKRGASRTVLLLAGYALKLPSFRSWKLFLSGLLANMQESEFAKTGWPELCPVVFRIPGGFLVIMPECEILDERLTPDEYETFVSQPDYRVPAENKRDSFGYLNGRLVAVDYG